MGPIPATWPPLHPHLTPTTSKRAILWCGIRYEWVCGLGRRCMFRPTQKDARLVDPLGTHTVPKGGGIGDNIMCAPAPLFAVAGRCMMLEAMDNASQERIVNAEVACSIVHRLALGCVKKRTGTWRDPWSRMGGGHDVSHAIRFKGRGERRPRRGAALGELRSSTSAATPSRRGGRSRRTPPLSCGASPRSHRPAPAGPAPAIPRCTAAGG